MIRIERLLVRAGDLARLVDVSLEAAPGEAWALVGAGGCGKGALVAAVAGAVEAAGGDVVVAGKSLRREPAEARRACGYCPADLGVWPAVSAGEQDEREQPERPLGLAQAGRTQRGLGNVDRQVGAEASAEFRLRTAELDAEPLAPGAEHRPHADGEVVDADAGPPSGEVMAELMHQDQEPEPQDDDEEVQPADEVHAGSLVTLRWRGSSQARGRDDGCTTRVRRRRPGARRRGCRPDRTAAPTCTHRRARRCP